MVGTMGRVWFVLMLALAFAPAAARADSAAYTLATGDRIAITVVGQSELSGEHVIDDAGAISFPLVGAIAARGLTAAALQQRLIEKLADGFLAQPSVFVRIAELRPVQVMGDVRTPGSFPFRHGQIVKTLIALAGGHGDPRVTEVNALSEQLLAVERLRLIDVNRVRLSVAKARLEAQRDDAQDFAAPEPSKIDDADEFRSAVADELKIFQSQTSALRRQIELIKSQTASLQAESSAVDAQIASERKQLTILNEQLENYQKLAKNGLTRAENVLQLQLALAAKESNLWRLEADLSRLKVSTGEIGIRVQEAENAYKRQVWTDLQDVTRRLQENTAAEPTARELLAVKSDLGRPRTPAIISITRLRDGTASLIEASETTPVEPGDIIEIRSARMGLGHRLAGERAQADNDRTTTYSAR